MGTEPPQESPPATELPEGFNEWTPEQRRIWRSQTRPDRHQQSRMTLGGQKCLPSYDHNKHGDHGHDYADTAPDHGSREPGVWTENDQELFDSRFDVEGIALKAREQGGANQEDLARLFAWICWAVDILTEFEEINRDARLARELLERLAVEAIGDPGFLLIRLMYLSPETSSIEDVIRRSVKAGRKLSRRVTKECIHKRFVNYAARNPEWIPFLCPGSEKVHRLREQLGT